MSADEHEQLVAEVERICRGSSPSHGPSTTGFDSAAWQRLEQAGYTLVSVQPDLGGSGGTLEHAADVIQAAGRAAVEVPLIETMLAGWLLASAGVPVPLGPLTAAAFEPGAALQSTEQGWELTGVLRRVPWAAAAERIVGVLPTEAGTRLVLLSPQLVDIVAGTNLAGEPRNDVVCQGVQLAQADVVDAGADVIVAAFERRATLGSVLAMAGAAERVLALAVRHASEREQFGRPIARFQAVQHLLAGMAAETASIVVAAQAAVLALERGTEDEAHFAIAAAKASASRSAGVVAAAGHQVLGALGFTLEHPLHRSTRRLWAWRDEQGSERSAHLDLAARITNGDVWDLICGSR